MRAVTHQPATPIEKLNILTGNIIPNARWQDNNGTARLILPADQGHADFLTVDALKKAFEEFNIDVEVFVGNKNRGRWYGALVSIEQTDQLAAIGSKHFESVYSNKRINSNFYPAKGVLEDDLISLPNKFHLDERIILSRFDQLFQKHLVKNSGVRENIAAKIMDIEKSVCRGVPGSNFKIDVEEGYIPKKPPYYFMISLPGDINVPYSGHTVCAAFDGKTLVYIDSFGNPIPEYMKDAFEQNIPGGVKKIISSDLCTQGTDLICSIRAMANLMDLKRLVDAGQLHEFKPENHLIIHTIDCNLFPIFEKIADAIHTKVLVPNAFKPEERFEFLAEGLKIKTTYIDNDVLLIATPYFIARDSQLDKRTLCKIGKFYDKLGVNEKDRVYGKDSIFPNYNRLQINNPSEGLLESVRKFEKKEFAKEIQFSRIHFGQDNGYVEIKTGYILKRNVDHNGVGETLDKVCGAMGVQHKNRDYIVNNILVTDGVLRIKKPNPGMIADMKRFKNELLNETAPVPSKHTRIADSHNSRGGI
jgi:hypothetical protein